jgi:regulator of sigma E protease
MAKLFGVKVEVFSLGFGKKLFRRQIGETEYCLSLFPLGGYVKLMGDDPYKGVPASEAERAFSTQKLYKRFLIVAAGPLSNLLLAYVLFTAVFWFGQPMAGTRIGEVFVDSPAWKAGLRPGDKLLSIGDTPVQTWNDIEDTAKAKVGEKIELKLERGNSPLTLPYTVGLIHSKNVYGEDEDVGGIDGIEPNPLEAMIGISNPKSAAYVAGLRTGDVFTKIGDRPVATYEEMKAAFADQWAEGKSISVTIKRGLSSSDSGTDHVFSIQFPAKPASAEQSPLGIYPSELFVNKVTPNSPAEKGGLQPGDRVVAVGDRTIYNFETIIDEVQKVGVKGDVVKLTLDRDGQPVILNLKPIETTQQDPITQAAVKKYVVGFAPQKAVHEAEMVKLQIHDPKRLIDKAISETNLLAKRMVISIAKLVTGSISVKNLGGPVLIASVAGKSLDAGIIPFVQMMALISINLFLLNLFPIPVLDGGHLLFFLIEGVKGKPVSIRTMEIANQVGMVFILMLVGLTLFNDISRIVLH